MENACKYPIILVHGMFGWGEDEGINDHLPYWGANTCNIKEHYCELGYNVHCVSVGPASSAWDRACELYARLTGGAVDYGKAHSERFSHKRYGRYYGEPLLENWDAENRIHLVGHSFGGNTIRLLCHLLTYGDRDEQAATDPDDLSPLFAGGHEDLVASIVTICSPHNGSTTFLTAEKFRILPVLKFIVYNYMGIMGRSPAEGTIFDFHLEQFGLSDTPGQKDAYPLRRAKKKFKANRDNVEFDLQPAGAKTINDYLEISPNVYYFSYSYNAVSCNFNGKVHIPWHIDFPFLAFTSELVLIYNHFFRPAKDLPFEDYCNDGLVDLTSAMHPKDEPFVFYKKGDFNKGVWNVMKPRYGDHGTPIGLMAPVEDTFALYDEIFGLMKTVEEKIASGEKSATPVKARAAKADERPAEKPTKPVAKRPAKKPAKEKTEPDSVTAAENKPRAKKPAAKKPAPRKKAEAAE